MNHNKRFVLKALYQKWQVFKLFLIFYNRTPIVFAMIFTAICATTLWLFLHFVEIKKQNIETALKIQAEKIVSNITYKLDHSRAIMHNMGKLIAQDPHNKQHLKKILESHKDNQELKESFSWTAFSWANSHHHITVSELEGIVDKSNIVSIAHRSYISDIVENPGKLITGEPTLGATSKKWLLPVGLGVTDDKERYLGALIVGIEIDALSQSINNELDNENVSFELISWDGKIILYGYKSSFGFAQGLLTEKDIIDNMRDELKYGKITNIADISLFRNRHAILGRKIEGFPHYLILRYDDNAIKKELLESFTSRAFTLSFLSFVIILFLLLVYKREKHQEEIISHLSHENHESKD